MAHPRLQKTPKPSLLVGRYNKRLHGFPESPKGIVYQPEQTPIEWLPINQTREYHRCNSECRLRGFYPVLASIPLPRGPLANSDNDPRATVDRQLQALHSLEPLILLRLSFKPQQQRKVISQMSGGLRAHRMQLRAHLLTHMFAVIKVLTPSLDDAKAADAQNP